MHFRKFNWSFLKEVAVYSFWIFLNVIMDRIYWSTGQFVLGAMVGTAAVAVFAVAIQLQHLYMQFSTAVSSVFLPKVTSMVTTSNDRTAISNLFVRTGRIQYIIMALILSGFIVFGRQFINLWAGPGYEDAYIICVLFFASLLIPLIQNLGITILQARNQMKFRSLLYIVIALVALVLQIVLAKQYGGIGCAIAVAGALLLGQGLIMNIYYSKKQVINIGKFLSEILKMSIVPIALTIASLFIVRSYDINSWGELALAILIFCIVYIPLFWVFSLNKYERNLIKAPLQILYHERNLNNDRNKRKT